MFPIFHLLNLFAAAFPAASAPSSPAGWTFVQNGTSGIVIIEAVVVSPTLALTFDRAQNDPLQLDGFSAWGALWNFQTNTASPVSVGGNAVESPATEPDKDGRMMIRLFDPCTDANGVGCTVFEDPSTLHLTTTRWYPSSLRIFDGSLMVIGGIRNTTSFYNNVSAAINSFEFFPPKDSGVARPSPFLNRSLPANLFPRGFALPDGRVFLVANNRTMIYNVETDTETILPDIPNGVRVTNPFDGTATLLPLSPPLYTPEILVCGGSNSSDAIPSEELSSQDPASDQCSRIEVTAAGIRRGWIVERMPEGRIMPEMILLPDGKVLIVNGGGTGYAAINSVADAVDGQSNADHPVFRPVLYDPKAPLGQRFSNEDLPSSDIARLYHSTATLTPNGNIFIGGSNPNQNPNIVNNTRLHTEFRIEYLNPPYMTVPRPELHDVPSTVLFDHDITVSVTLPRGLDAKNIQVALIDLGFSTHAFHSSERVVFLQADLSPDQRSILIKTPPNNRVYPPGPGWIFLTVDGITSVGVHVLVGNGEAPPVQDQGMPAEHGGPDWTFHDHSLSIGFEILELIRQFAISQLTLLLKDRLRNLAICPSPVLTVAPRRLLRNYCLPSILLAIHHHPPPPLRITYLTMAGHVMLQDTLGMVHEHQPTENSTNPPPDIPILDQISGGSQGNKSIGCSGLTRQTAFNTALDVKITNYGNVESLAKGHWSLYVMESKGSIFSY
ncbi:hypothetical protein H0H93_009234 [Arthromyces matolae]|nr:hypothetical protein H0H93_009234 [Arthromyces matolae]